MSAKKVSLEMLLEELTALKSALSRADREFLTVEDLVEVTGFSQSYIYKLTHRKEIPFYRPSGKKIFFKRDEVNEWLTQNRTASEYELSSNIILNKVFRKTR